MNGVGKWTSSKAHEGQTSLSWSWGCSNLDKMPSRGRNIPSVLVPVFEPYRGKHRRVVQCVLVGYAATFSGVQCVLVGYAATLLGVQCVLVGYAATLSGIQCVLVGYAATLSGIQCVLVGYAATLSDIQFVLTGHVATLSGLICVLVSRLPIGVNRKVL